MAKSVNIKKGDTVKVIAGKDKGAEGKVIQVLREEQRVIVEGVNRIKRHTKVVNQGGRDGTTGGIITAEAPIHASNVMLVVESDNGKTTTKVGSAVVDGAGAGGIHGGSPTSSLWADVSVSNLCGDVRTGAVTNHRFS